MPGEVEPSLHRCTACGQAWTAEEDRSLCCPRCGASSGIAQISRRPRLGTRPPRPAAPQEDWEGPSWTAPRPERAPPVAPVPWRWHHFRDFDQIVQLLKRETAIPQFRYFRTASGRVRIEGSGFVVWLDPEGPRLELLPPDSRRGSQSGGKGEPPMDSTQERFRQLDLD